MNDPLLATRRASLAFSAGMLATGVLAACNSYPPFTVVT
jgi:hypothetical protein